MVALFICLILIIVLVASAGVLFLKKSGVEVTPKKTDAELDEDIPVEDLHTIIRHQYITSPYNDTQVWAQVVCVCGWTEATARKEYAAGRGEQHINNERDKILNKREAARRVAEKLAENEKGDFAW